MGLTKIHYGLSAHTHAGTLGVFGMNFVKRGCNLNCVKACS